jgi:glycine dehydrogenase subunit 1
MSKARYLYKRLLSKGWNNPFKNDRFLWEFPVEHPSAKELRKKALKKGFLFGVELDRFYPELKNSVLIAVTEKRTKGDMDDLLNLL